MARQPMHSRGGLSVWDVARVAFPSADSAIRRNRPALVISAPEVDERFGVLWVLMIMSAGRTAWPGDVAIGDLGAAGLPVACVVRTEKIATIDARFADRAGRLAESDRPRVVENLRRIIAPALLVS